MIDLTGKPIAITGASSGIGKATALACARAGMPVAVAARREDRLTDLVRQIRDSGGKAIAVKADVVNQAECDALVDRTVAEFGSLYSIFANAGIGHESRVERMSDADMRGIFEVNYFGMLNTLRPAVPHILASKGHILICSSCLSKLAMPYHGAYSATKAAQAHVCRAMNIELKAHSIRVSSVHPIGTETEFSQASAERRGERREKAHTNTPGMFMQPPERVAKAVIRCLSKPKPEVWTSFTMRTMSGFITMFPSLGDAVMRRAVRRERT